MPRKTLSPSTVKADGKKKPTSKKRNTASKKPPANKTDSRKPKLAKAATAINPMQRHKMIEVAAYYLAERRGFTTSDPQHDWFRAEHEVDELLKASQINVT